MNDSSRQNPGLSPGLVLLDEPRTTVAWNKFSASCFCVPGLKRLAHSAGRSISGLREDGGIFEWPSPGKCRRNDGLGAFFRDDDCSSILSDMTGSETNSYFSSSEDDSDDDGGGGDDEPIMIYWSDDRPRDLDSIDARRYWTSGANKSKPATLKGVLGNTGHRRRAVSAIRSATNDCHSTSCNSMNSCGSETLVVKKDASFFSSPSSSISTLPHGNRTRSYTGDNSSAGQLSLGSSTESLHRRTSPIVCHKNDNLPHSEGKYTRTTTLPKLPKLPPPQNPPQSSYLGKLRPRRHRRSDTDLSALQMEKLYDGTSCGGEDGNKSDSGLGGSVKREGERGSSNGSAAAAAFTSEHNRRRKSPSPASFGSTYRKPPKQPNASCDHLTAANFLSKNPILERSHSSTTGTTVLSGWIVALFGARAVSTTSTSSSAKSSDRSPDFGAGDVYYLRIVQQHREKTEALVLHRPTDGRPVRSLPIKRDWTVRSLDSEDRRVGRSILIVAGPDAVAATGDAARIRMVPVALTEQWRNTMDRRLKDHQSAAMEDDSDRCASDEGDTGSAFVLPGHGRFAPDGQLDTARHLFFTIDSFVKHHHQQPEEQQPRWSGSVS